MRSDKFLTIYFFRFIDRFTRPKNKLRIPILMYHSVSETDSERRHPYYGTNTLPEIFEQQMKFLSENGYRVVSMKDALALIRRNMEHRPYACSEEEYPPAATTLQKVAIITFDDGLRDFYDTAWPILKEYGFPAAMFLPTGFISHERRRLNGRECLTWREARELSSDGVEFGAHTVSHVQLYRVDRRTAEQEMRDAKAAIEQALGFPVLNYSYAYAFPEHDPDFVAFFRDALVQAGYRAAVTTRIGTAAAGDDPYTLRRLPVNSHDDEELFQAKLEGAYDWLAWPQRITKRLRGGAGF